MIDSPDKAYWIGYIWCDGHVERREGKRSTHYEFRLGITNNDSQHLLQIRNALESSHPIKTCRNYSKPFNTDTVQCYLSIANDYFGGVLYNNYGLISHRSDVSKLLSKIPEKYHKHFIRGILEADGSLNGRWMYDKYKNRMDYKMMVCWSTYEELLSFIQDNLLRNNLIKNKAKIGRRHKDRDEVCREIKYCGNLQVPKILDYLYKGASVYMERKYSQYQKIVNFV